MFRNVLIFSIASFVLLIHLGCGKKADVVARVENLNITTEEFRLVLVNQFNTKDLSTISIEDKRKALDQLIDKRMKYLAAVDLGLNQDEEFRSIVDQRKDRIMVQELYQEEILDNFVPDELLKKYFNWQQFEVKAGYVLVGFVGTTGYKGKTTKQEAEKLLPDIIESLHQGQSIEEVALKYSNDPLVERTKGILNPYQIGRFSPEVDEEAFTGEPGKISGPFLTPAGYVILKVLERKYLPDGRNFEQDKEKIKRKLFNSYFAEPANKMYKNYSLKLANKYHVEYNDVNIKRFFDLVKDLQKMDKPRQSDISEKDLKLTVAKLEGKPITIGYIIEQFQGRFIENLSRFTSMLVLKDIIKNVVSWQAWVTEARNRHIDQRDDVKKQIQDFSMNQLVSFFDRKEIRESIEITDQEIEAYYEENKSKYVEPERIEIWEIAVTDEKLATNLKLRARQGGDFKELAKKYSEKKSSKRKGGYLGFQTKKSIFTAIVEKAFEAGPDKIVGPFKHGIYYYVIKTGKYQPERQQELGEVKGIIRSAIRTEKQTKRRQEVMEKIRKQYSYRINESLLRRMA